MKRIEEGEEAVSDSLKDSNIKNIILKEGKIESEELKYMLEDLIKSKDPDKPKFVIRRSGRFN